MEGAFGSDFGSVRVHAGPTAKDLNEQLGAKAFTRGSDIFFRDGMPNTTSSEGLQLLAHELTHTVQQGSATARQVDVVRRAEVTVAGGTFKDDVGDGYIPYNDKDPHEALWSHGAQMSQLEFRPAMGVTNDRGEPATEVSLVQTTNSTVKQKAQVAVVKDQPESLLNERRTEKGAAVDQQIYLSEKIR